MTDLEALENTLRSGIAANPATVLALCEEVRRLRSALIRISAIRDSIIGAQTVNWSEHVYPIGAALADAGYEGAGYTEARAKVTADLRERAAALAVVEAVREASSWFGGGELGDHPGDVIRRKLRDALATFDAAKREVDR